MKIFGSILRKQSWWKRVRLPALPPLPFLKNQKVKKFNRKVLWLLLVPLVVSVGFGVWFFHDLPSPKKLMSGEYPVSTQIFDRNGILLYEVFADEHRTPVKLEILPKYVTQATIAIEDKDFYKHFGFSGMGMIRAIKNTLFANKLQGGSTITQQLVKTALLTPERTITRKVKEAVLTIGTELLYSKDQILEMYLNHIPYGGTAYGIEAASQRYFGKPAQNLTLAEASLLVGLPQAPSRYSPFVNPEAARARQQEVLRRMMEEKFITKEQMQQASNVVLNYAKPATDIRAPHFVFFIKQLLEEKYGMETVERGGLRVKTTLDLNLQDYAQASVSAEIASLQKMKVGNGAALVTRPKTGEILAMIGSKDYFDSENDGQVNLTMRMRQPGSSIKPINYVTAIQEKRLTASSVLLDIPTCFFVGGAPQPYCPKNYNGGFSGPVSVRYALANSLNIPAVKILAINSLESMIATASAMGINSFRDPSNYGLSLTLGGGEVMMTEMVTAFGTLANQGVRVPLNPILEVKDYTGKVFETYDPQVVQNEVNSYFDEADPDANVIGVTRMRLTRALNREPAYIIADIMADNNARSPTFGINSKLKIKNKTVSAKTGTTNDIRDNWTIGFTPDVVVATWVGNNDGSAMNPYLVSGITGAAPIWNAIMSKAIENLPDNPQPKPQGIETITICNETGTYVDPNVPCNPRSEYFWAERPPFGSPIEKKAIWVTRDTNLPAFVGSTTSEAPEMIDTSNLELKEHVVMNDPFTREFCLDCTYPVSDKGKLQYPTINVNMLTFQWGGAFEVLE